MSAQNDRLNVGHERYGVPINSRKVENLVRICAMCKKNMGEKPPLDDKSQTHGYCDECLKKVMAERNNAVTLDTVSLDIYGLRYRDLADEQQDRVIRKLETELRI